MGNRIVIYLGPRSDEPQEKPEKSTESKSDPWRFGELRKTLWGTGGSKDPIGVGGLRRIIVGR